MDAGGQGFSVGMLPLDGQLYTWNGYAWTSVAQQIAAIGVTVPAANIVGQLTNDQIVSLAAAKITGTLTDSQLASIAAAKLIGSIVDSQLAGISATKVTGQLSDSQLAAIAAAKLVGQLNGSQIAASTITAGNIAADTITADKIAASAITATELAAGAVTAGKVAADAIDSLQIKALAITAGKIAAKSITAAEIATAAITAAEIAAQAVTAEKLAANSVLAQNIAAGAIVTEKLAVASASNIVWNSCLELTQDGWNFGGIISGWGTTKGTALEAAWRCVGVGSGYMFAARTLANIGTVPTDYMEAAWDPSYAVDGSIGAAFPSGIAIEAQGRLAPYMCAAYVRMLCLDANGNILSTTYGNRIAMPLPADGRTLDRYQVSWCKATTPAGTVRVRLSVIAFRDPGSDIPAQTAPPYCFYTQLAIGAGVANSTEPQPWQPGGVTSIAGGMIRSQSIQAGQIGANAIVSDKLAANSVIAGKIATNAVVAGTVAAGAIGASEIAAGQIRATHLAADFVLAYASQFGTAVIGTAQIQDLSVGTLKIANAAVTNIAWTIAYKVQDCAVWVWTDGSPVFICAVGNGGAAWDGSSNVPASGGFYRDGQPMFAGIMQGTAFMDYPPAGSHYYQWHWDGNWISTGSGVSWYPWDPWFKDGGYYGGADASYNQILCMTIKR